ncbi:ECF transporter S component [Bacillus massiliglaciei]|uniref:ECF transporter S component n=1 Tax=Bacillus massiliglaciei TaxID=1816693 RepID=UPI000B284B13|nr:ECF transporter S component [Bacillus massiliglaciei]
MKLNIRTVSLLGLFIALSGAGGILKIPSIIGSIALDSFPALIAAVLLGPWAGAIAGGLGHLLSALMASMPLGPFHFLIMLEMAVLIWLFGYLYRAGKAFAASLLFFAGNGFILSVPFIYIISMSFYAALLPGMLAATVINLLLALILLPRLKPIFGKLENGGMKE